MMAIASKVLYDYVSSIYVTGIRKQESRSLVLFILANLASNDTAFFQLFQKVTL